MLLYDLPGLNRLALYWLALYRLALDVGGLRLGAVRIYPLIASLQVAGFVRGLYGLRLRHGARVGYPRACLSRLRLRSWLEVLLRTPVMTLLELAAALGIGGW